MLAGNENEHILHSVTNRNWEEMRQQTLDALKVVHSFEAKPARSVCVQELLAEKTQARQLASAEAAHSARDATDTTVLCSTQDAAPRQALKPVVNTASPEKRFVSSPKKVSSCSGSPARSSVHSKNGLTTHEASPAKAIFAKRLKQSKATTAASGLKDSITALHARGSDVPSTQLNRPRPQSTRHQDLSFTNASTGSLRTARGLARTGSTTSSFRSASRLLQPTAASAAKMRPVRTPITATRPDRLPQLEPLPHGDSSGKRVTASSSMRPSTFARPLSSLSSTTTKSKLTLPSLQQRMGAAGTLQASMPRATTLRANVSQANSQSSGVTQSTESQSCTLKAAQEAAAGNEKISPAVKFPYLHSCSTSNGVASLESAAAGADAVVNGPQTSKSLLSSVLTKTHNNKTAVHEEPRSPSGMLNSAQVTAASPHLPSKPQGNGPAEHPAITSTPVRSTPNFSIGEHTSGSLHSFDFTNFSFEAEWANTPELKRKVQEQQNIDTIQLFGRMPPINLERIFGTEMKRQRR